MFPEQTEVFFVHTDRVFDHTRRAGPIVGTNIKIVDVTKTIAAQLQRIQRGADTVLSGVEGIASHITRARIAIRYNHFRHRRAVHDWAQAAFVLIANLMENESFS